MRYFIAMLGLFATGNCGYAQSLVFVSVAGENRIAQYRMDEQSGDLSLIGSIDVGGGPGAMALSPRGDVLFASIRSIGHLASFSIQAEDGRLRPISQVAAGADPAYVAIDRSGKFLISAYYQAGKVMVHEVADTGAIVREVQSIETADKAHAAVPDRSGRFWFVPHTGPNAIFQFRFDPETGMMRPNDVAVLQREPASGPRHLWFHPTLAVAYSSDEQGRSISAYEFDATAGNLQKFQTLSTLPPDADRTRPGSTSDIEVHPSGEFVFVANRGHDSIARYAIGSEDGALQYLGNTPSEATTRSFNIDSKGRFLVAAGQNSGKLAVFRIDEANGDLNRLHTIDVGKSPWWVQIR